MAVHKVRHRELVRGEPAPAGASAVGWVVIMTKQELEELNAELVEFLIGLRDQIDETLAELAAVGIGEDDGMAEDDED